MSERSIDHNLQYAALVRQHNRRVPYRDALVSLHEDVDRLVSEYDAYVRVNPHEGR